MPTIAFLAEGLDTSAGDGPEHKRYATPPLSSRPVETHCAPITTFAW